MTTIAESSLEAPSQEASQKELQQGSQKDSPREAEGPPIRYRHEEFWRRMFVSAIVGAVALAAIVALWMRPFS